MRGYMSERAALVRAVLFTVAVLALGAVDASSQEVTYARDVAPIIQENCQQCHMEGSIAPIHLTNYDEARRYARRIRTKVEGRVMPPWHLDRTVGIQEFKNDRSLTDEEIETIVTWVDKGTPFGDESDVLVEAATDVRLCSFPLDMLQTMMAGSAAFETRMHRQALRQLDDARDWIMTLGRKNAAEKVASFLLMLSRHVRPQQEGYSTSFALPMGRSDIADFLGLTTETVSRQLTRLRKDGAIAIERTRHVEVLDLDELKEVAAGGT